MQVQQQPVERVPAQAAAPAVSASEAPLQLQPRLFSKSKGAWQHGYEAVLVGGQLKWRVTLKRKVRLVAAKLLMKTAACCCFWQANDLSKLRMQSGAQDEHYHTSELAASDAAAALWARSRGAACTRAAAPAAGNA